MPRTDPRGRAVDTLALRLTFGTHLSAASVHPRTAMAAMRHSRIELTMNLHKACPMSRALRTSAKGKPGWSRKGAATSWKLALSAAGREVAVAIGKALPGFCADTSQGGP
jgi:hypothetical protein